MAAWPIQQTMLIVVRRCPMTGRIEDMMRNHRLAGGGIPRIFSNRKILEIRKTFFKKKH